MRVPRQISGISWMLTICLIILSGCGGDSDSEDYYVPQADPAADSQLTHDAYPYESPDDTEPDAEDNLGTVISAEPQRDNVIPLGLQYALDVANIRRENLVRPNIDRIAGLVEGRTTRLDMMRFYQPPERTGGQLLSTADAMYDAQAFFDSLRYTYGAYTYFGGDEVFLPIFNEIMDTLAGYDYWDVRDFGNLIFDSLRPMLRDNHLSFGGHRFSVSADIYVWASPFDRTPYGFRSRLNGLYVAEIVGHDLEDVFRLNIDNTGDMHYIPIIVVRGGAGTRHYPVTVRYENDDYEIVDFIRHSPTRRDFSNSRLRREQGIPIVTVRTMGFPASTHRGSNAIDAQRFLSFAEELRDEPIVIVDIRSNGGGFGLLSAQWLYLLTGEIVPNNFMWLMTRSYHEWQEVIASGTPESMFYIPTDVFRQFSLSEPVGDYHTLNRSPTEGIVQRDQILILLVDRYTASAGDGFADRMFNMTNTLVVGQNTGGVLHTDLTHPNLFLPRSGLNFGMGRSINIHPEGHLDEGVGITPDIWVTGNALTAVLAMLSRE